MINFKKTVAVFGPQIPIEDAETLLAWLCDHRSAKVNLKELEHPHTAVLQVLMAAKPDVTVWPSNPTVRQWIEPMMAR